MVDERKAFWLAVVTLAITVCGVGLTLWENAPLILKQAAPWVALVSGVVAVAAGIQYARYAGAAGWVGAQLRRVWRPWPTSQKASTSPGESKQAEELVVESVRGKETEPDTKTSRETAKGVLGLLRFGGNQERERRRELVASWRKMLAESIEASQNGEDFLATLSRRPEWHSLNAKMRPDVLESLSSANSKVLQAMTSTARLVGGETLPPGAGLIQDEITRLENEWGLTP